MSKERSLIGLWLLIVALIVIASMVFPHRDFGSAGLANIALQVLLCLISTAIVMNSQGTGQKALYVFFSIFFGYGILLLGSSFVGEAIFTSNPHHAFWYHVYVNQVGLALSVLLVVFYLIAECGWPQLAVWKKVIGSTLLACTITGVFFGTFIEHPMALKSEPEYQKVGLISEGVARFEKEYQRAPSDDELFSWLQKQGQSKVSGFVIQQIDVQRLRPYVDNNDHAIIFWRPLNRIALLIHGAVVVALSMLLILVLSMKKSYSAYTDKIIVSLLLFEAVEVLHVYGFDQVTKSTTFDIVFQSGQYITIVFLGLMVYVFERKLHFVLSVAGRYYEYAILHESETMTRFRDEIDCFLLRTFLKSRRSMNTVVHLSQPKSEYSEYSIELLEKTQEEVQGNEYSKIKEEKT